MTRLLQYAFLTFAILAFALPAHPCFMLGDFTGDCRVDFQDLLILADNWFSPAACTEEGLVARWKLDEAIGTTAADASGRDHHGTIIGDPLWNPYGGKLAGALRLDGVDDHIIITGYKGLTGTTPRTCSAWIKTADTNGVIIGWGRIGVAGGRWIVMINGDGLLRTEVGGGYIIGSTVLSNDVWRHIAVVSDGVDTNSIRLYVDGLPETRSDCVTRAITTIADADVEIGAFAETQNFFGGSLDDIRIYDRALTDQEVWLLANAATTSHTCLDVDGDDRLAIADFARLAGYWNDQRPPVVINEFLSDNDSILLTIVNGATEYCDWIELYNNTPHAVDLSGWYLTDKQDEPRQWRFPDGVTMQSGQYLIVFASGNTLADNINNYPFVDDLGFLHTNFRLSDSGEYLALVAPDGETVVHAYADYKLSSGEFGYPPQESDVSYGLESAAQRYFAVPTPAGPNRDAFDGFVAQPQISPPGGLFTGPVDVTITCPMPGAIIRYTTNGTAPTLSNGATYQKPIRISNMTNLMVACFRPGWRPSQTEVHPYVFVDPSLTSFNSNLPLVVVDTKGLSIYDGFFQPAYVVVIDAADDGRAAITGPVDFAGWGGIKTRGSSSLQFPKKQFAFETWDGLKEDTNVSILSMPAESDWILYAPYSDKSLMRNYLAYKWSNDIGRYAVRTRFVEVFLNTNGDKVTMSDYAGVYVFMEKIKRDADRVNITRIGPSDNLLPEVSGGYIVKKDRLDPGDSGFHTSLGQHLAYVEPKEREITVPQRNWLWQYFNSFESALYSSNYTDPVNGYAAWIDVDSWIDIHIMVELCKNIDGYRLSSFMYKDRNGKLHMGPIWDYNLSLGNANYLDGWLPQGWYYEHRDLSAYDYPWYPRLFTDPAFKRRYADRWCALRRNQFATDRLLRDVDDAARLLQEAQERNFKRWPILGVHVWPNWYIAPTWQAEVDWMKNWITNRVAWMDSQIAMQYAPAPPTFGRQGGQVPNPFDLTMSASGRTVYYTIDGPDPMATTARIRYTKPVRLTKTCRVMARSYALGQWSAYNEAVFTVGPVPQNLRITEIMFHPWTDPNLTVPEAEFIELANIGTEAINLNLCRFTNGIDFTSGDLTLAPGERTVVINNRALFEETYPDFTGSIAGEYVGSLDNMGERITLVDPTGQTIHNFTYLDTWYDITDGGGFSLTIKDPTRGELERIEGGLAGHWKLDEYYGATAADASEAARAGVVRGNPKWRSYGGKINGAIELDGAGSYVEIPDYKGILGGAPRTCAAWIKTSASGVDIVGWGPKGVPYVRWAFTINQSGRLAVEFGGGFVAGTTLVNDDKWHHVAAVLEGPFSDDTRLYVDGRPDPISTLYSLTADTQPGPNVGIGTHLDLRRDFRGLIDNVLIYDRALTADEVALLGASADHWEGKQYWRPSAHMGGSPGQDDTGTVPELGAVVINEILAHSHGSDPDWIELYNTTDEPIDISGWFLSDDNDNYMKFRITAGTVIEPHGYVVFYENQHFNNAQNPGCLKPFALSENGETLYVRSGLDANNNLTGYYEEESFDASETGVAFGRYRKSTGTHNFVAMSYNTPGAPNAYPKVGPIVISEIMYNPPGDAEYEGSDYEFVELCNISDVPVTLQEYDPIRHVMLTWRFTDAIEYTFPLNTTIPPGGFVVVAKNPQAFTARYGPVANVFGPYGGKLANEGEKLEISMPGDTDAQGTRYYIRVDRVNYSDSPEWPQTADGEGDSLTRINLTHYGNDPANWHAAPPTPGQ